jgi:hypothetical protein
MTAVGFASHLIIQEKMEQIAPTRISGALVVGAIVASVFRHNRRPHGSNERLAMFTAMKKRPRRA